MSATWATVIGLAAATALLRASGPLLIGHRELPPWAPAVITVLPGALLTAMIVVQVFGEGSKIVIDERLAGVAVAGAVLLLNRRAMLPAILLAAVTAALLRALL